MRKCSLALIALILELAGCGPRRRLRERYARRPPQSLRAARLSLPASRGDRDRLLCSPTSAISPRGSAFATSKPRTGIDSKNKLVSAGDRSFRYDALVVAVGAETAYPEIPGLAANSLGLRTPADAARLRKRVKKELRQAARLKDPAARRDRARIVIGGAGPTGVELAAEIAEAAPTLARESGLRPSEASVVLVQRSDVLSKADFLRDSDRRSSSTERQHASLRRSSKKLGVRVLTGASLERVSADHVEVKSEDGRRPSLSA